MENKTYLCKFYCQGSCKYGCKCKYLHPKCLDCGIYIWRTTHGDIYECNEFGKEIRDNGSLRLHNDHPAETCSLCLKRKCVCFDMLTKYSDDIYYTSH